jgi:hypothetical protein
MTDVPVFDIRTPEDFFKKLLEERRDLKASHDQCSRHALNAILTACHLTDWVWAIVEGRSDLHRKWRLRKVDLCHFRDFVESCCPLQATARAVANRTKHAKIRSSEVTAVVGGAFDPVAFDPVAFDVRHLSIVDSNGAESKMPDFLDELIRFWRRFLRNELGLTVS